MGRFEDLKQEHELSAERDGLLELRSATLALVDDKLELVIEGTNAYELSSATHRLDQHIRVRQGKLAVSGARGWARTGVERLRDGAVRLMYQRSRGVLLARHKLGALRGAESVVDRVACMVRDYLPKPEVVRALPYYYRQLFFGQGGANETFWVGRKPQISRARQALEQFEAGTSGSIIVMGDRLSGKSALMQKLASDVFERREVYRVHAPLGGSIDRRAFVRAMRKAVGKDFAQTKGSTSLTSLLSAVPRGSVLMLDDLNLWWERSPEGCVIIEEILAIIASQGRRLLFILGVETQAYRLMNRLVDLSDYAIAILECDPLPAESLRSIVSLRHSSTGLKYRWGSKDEHEVGALSTARMFSQYFDHTGGCVGATLRAWACNIARVRGDVLEIVAPARRDWECLDGLETRWVAVLIQLSLHKQMTVERLTRVSGVSREHIDQVLGALQRMGLVVQSHRRIVEIDPNIFPAIQERFAKRGLFA